jgi:hypothetical protein
MANYRLVGSVDCPLFALAERCAFRFVPYRLEIFQNSCQEWMAQRDSHVHPLSLQLWLSSLIAVADTLQRALPVSKIDIELVSPDEWSARLERARSELGFPLADEPSHFIYNGATRKYIGDVDVFQAEVCAIPFH